MARPLPRPRRPPHHVGRNAASVVAERDRPSHDPCRLSVGLRCAEAGHSPVAPTGSWCARWTRASRRVRRCSRRVAPTGSWCARWTYRRRRERRCWVWPVRPARRSGPATWSRRPGWQADGPAPGPCRAPPSGPGRRSRWPPGRCGPGRSARTRTGSPPRAGPLSMSMSMSGGPSRSGERNRSNSSPNATASTLVMPST